MVSEGPLSVRTRRTGPSKTAMEAGVVSKKDIGSRVTIADKLQTERTS